MNEFLDSNFESEKNSLDEYDPDDCDLTISKETFNGMRVFDRINTTKASHYFQIRINGHPKFIHKQTAARLLTLNRNCLPADRLSRVQATSKQQ